MNWIDVNDNLPSNDSFVLCTRFSKDYNHYYCYVCTYEDGCFLNDEGLKITVSHWQELPPKPLV